MNVQRYHPWLRWFLIFAALTLLGTAPRVVAEEEEPNNTCASATLIGAITLPVDLSAELMESTMPGDVDFYRFEAAAGTPIDVKLLGQTSSSGTLTDPLLGFFDGDCASIAVNDDAIGRDSRLVITVPDDGVFVLAASAYPDFEFLGEHESAGTYRLSLNPVSAIGSISGRVIDSESASPVDAYVTLDACADPTDRQSCGSVASGSADADGFRFEGLENPSNPLSPGSYLVRANTTDHDFPGESAIFTVGQDEHHNVGDIEIVVPLSIGEISGRLVDAYTGVGIPGGYWGDELSLAYCVDGTCDFVAWTGPDEAGYFSFVPAYRGHLPAGDYRIVASAFEYLDGEAVDIPAVAHDEHREIGDIALKPWPIKLSLVRSCPDLPSTGGLCRYRVKVTNQSPKAIRGALWSLVETVTGSLAGDTKFQIGNPIRMTLRPGASRFMDFKFWIPASVPDTDYDLICATTRFGQGIHQMFFNTLARRDLCIQKGAEGYSLVSEKDVRSIMREKRGLPMPAPQLK